MKLNVAQKEYLLKDSIMFTSYELYKIFDCINYNWLIEQDFELVRSLTMTGWYDVFMNGAKYTSLNFKVYPEVLKQIKSL